VNSTDLSIEEWHERNVQLTIEDNHKPTPAEAHMAALLAGSITSAELAMKDFPEPRWVIPDLLPEGLSLLAGKPKTGKSWLALNIAAAVSIGGCVLGSIQVERGKVLYLALEDSERRLKGRLDLIQAVPTDKLHFFTAWAKGEDALSDLRLWLTQNADTRLVVVDTLQRIREPSVNGYSYSDDVEEIGKLATLAGGRRLAIMVLHHTRKMAAFDFVDEISGTSGVTGSSDTIWALQRPRGSVEATLLITGRDLEERELSLRYDSAVGWASLGDAGEHRRSKEREEVLATVRDAGEPITPKEVADLLEKNPSTIRGLIRKLRQEGVLFEMTTGKYTVTGGNGHNGTTGATR